MSSGKPVKQDKILACLPCRRRKLKCDHETPCANCIKSQRECIPGSKGQRPRKRRFPERELLNRLRRYEDLLKQNSIPFEPMHRGDSELSGNRHAQEDLEGPAEGSVESQKKSSLSPALRSGERLESKSAWHTMSRGFRESDHDSDSSQDDVREDVIKNEWEKFIEGSDGLLFSLPQGTIDLAAIHSSPVQIFKLWQVYLDNVNPLLKVTHAPCLQSRIIEASSDTRSIEPNLEALMCGIYCISTLSMTEEDCLRHLDGTKREVLMKYQLACQQALWNCKFLRSDSRDCLTAFFLYLISLRPSTSPQSLSSMLSIAIRTARRMGIHSEARLTRLSPFDAELSRRLWWALVLFDSRIGEIAGSNSSPLDPTWDCKLPLITNDSELWPQMREPLSTEHEVRKHTDAVFAVVRSELGDFIRHSSHHLDFTNPVLKALVKPGTTSHSESTEFAGLEKTLEQEYLSSCNMDSPLHAMTVWTTRASLNKYLLLESQSHHGTQEKPSEAERDKETSHAILILENDTMIMTSPLTKGFIWLNHAYFPFPAYMQLTQDLRKRPQERQAKRAWEAMDRNFEAWSDQFGSNGPFFRIFAKLVQAAWDASKESVHGDDGSSRAPGIVRAIARIESKQQQRPFQLEDDVNPSALNDGANDIDRDLVLQSQTLDQHPMPYTMEMQEQAAIGSSGFAGMFEPDLYMDWASLGGWPGWSAE